MKDYDEIYEEVLNYVEEIVEQCSHKEWTKSDIYACANGYIVTNFNGLNKETEIKLLDDVTNQYFLLNK